MAQLIFYQGSSISLTVNFYNTNKVLSDPDASPTFQIYDSTSTLVVSGTGSKVALGQWQASYFVGIQAPIGTWSIVWTATIGSVPILNNTEYFTVKVAGDVPETDIIIRDEWLRQVKKVLAFPGVPKVLLSDDQIKEFCIAPALFEYFRKFPIEVRTEQEISGELTVPFPDNFTMGATYASVTQRFGGTSTASSFWDIIRYQSLYGSSTSLSYSGRGNYGSRYNFNGMQQASMLQRAVADTYINMYSTFKAYVNNPLRQIDAYASSSAMLVVHWGKFSKDFADVEHTHIYDVIELAQSFLLFHLADSSSLLTDAQLDKNFNSDYIKTRAQELYDKVVTNKFSLYPGNLLIRSE